MHYDVAIVGAGPAGLALALALTGSNLSVCLFEHHSEIDLARPAADGREIALTHASRRALETLGVWDRLPPEEIAVLKDARVFDGPSLLALKLESSYARKPCLGWLVPNHLIRQALYEALTAAKAATLVAGTRVVRVAREREFVRLFLENGREATARLLVAADTRFSETRRALGIRASMLDFGRSMMLVRAEIEQPHEQTAWEWFGYGQTLALLPLNGQRAGVVLTLPQEEMARVLALDDAALSAELSARFEGRLGAVRVEGLRHVYPLVAVYAHDFVTRRAALIGDAAVGMHPVTAHGFNFGLASAMRLARELKAGAARGEDPATPRRLAAYERAHRLATWPLFQATNAIATMYTNDAAPAKALRRAALAAAQWLWPFKAGVVRWVTAG